MIKARSAMLFSMFAGAFAFFIVAPPAQAGSCHAHAHAHDQCGQWTWYQTKSGGSVSCEANANSPGVHSHAWASAECFLFFCNKVVGGHGWWTDGCGPKHYWWHYSVGTGRFTVVSKEPTAEMEVLIPVTAPPESLPPPSGEKPVEGAIARQGITAADDAIVELELKIGIGTADGKVLKVLEGTATLGGPRSSAPGLRATGALRRVLAGVKPRDPDSRLNRARVTKDFVSQRVKVPTNQQLEFHFDLSANVGGDDPDEDTIRDSSPPSGDYLSSAASLGATLRLVDQSGRFVLKSLDREEGDSEGGGKPKARRSQDPDPGR